MGKKNNDPVHEGKRRFWSGKVDTLCGQVLTADSTQEGVFVCLSVTCPAWKAARKAGRRL